jgi:hypothetical protein
MLTGRHPFATLGSDTGPANPSPFGIATDRFFAQALSVDPSNRPRSAARFAEELALALTL